MTQKEWLFENDGAWHTNGDNPVSTLPTSTPVAAFTFTVSGQSVSVDASSSTDTGSTLTSFGWDFGDTVTATGPTASHIYTTPGQKTITLYTTDALGNSATATQYVSISSVTATFTANVNFLAISFDGTGSQSLGSTIVSYLWDFGDGNSATGSNPAHTYATPGPRNVKLTVTDAAGTVASITQQVSPTSVLGNPVAAFTSTVSGMSVAFDASGSTDTTSTLTSYAWTFGDGGTATGKTASHLYSTAGTYTVSLTVADATNQTNTVTKSVVIAAPPVANKPPVASFVFTTSNLTVSFDGTKSSDSDGTPANHAWDFGDGQTVDHTSIPSHTYAKAGTYTVKLTVTDNSGATNVLSKTVAATAVPAPSFVYGTTKPTSANTGAGIIRARPTAAYTGDMTPNSSVTISDKVITGVLKPASGVTVTLSNCVIVLTGSYTSDTRALTADAGNITAEFCDIHSTSYNTHVNGAGLNGLTLDRCEIYDVVDGIDLTGKSTIKGCYIHDLLRISPDSSHPDNVTHCDAIQIVDGDSIDIWGNNIISMASSHSNASTSKHPQGLSCIMLTPNIGNITNLKIRDNWMDGGEISINGGGLDRAKGNTGAITGNRFGRNQYYSGHCIDLDSSATGITTSGNVYEDNGSAVTVRRNA